MIALRMEPTRLPPASSARRSRRSRRRHPLHAAAPGAPGMQLGGGRGEGDLARRQRARRVRRAVLTVLAIFMALVAMVSIGLGRLGTARPAVRPLLGAAAGVTAVAPLTESARLAPPPSTDANRFDTGWAPGVAAGVVGARALVPVRGSGRLMVVHLGEETERVLTLDLAPAGLPDGEAVSVRTGDRELARRAVHAAALTLRLPADLPVGEVPLDLVFGNPLAGSPAPAPAGAAAPGSPGAATAAAAPGHPGAGAAPPVPMVLGAALEPALPPGTAWLAGGDLVQSGNCLVYVPFTLSGNEALVGAFVPPRQARSGQRFELSVERADGTPIRRFHWVPSFWNRLRGTRRFELPLRGMTGRVRVRLISRAPAGGAPPGRWQGLGLIDVRGEILTPGQGQ